MLKRKTPQQNFAQPRQYHFFPDHSEGRILDGRFPAVGGGPGLSQMMSAMVLPGTGGQLARAELTGS